MALPYLHAQSCEDVSTATVTLSQRELTQAEKDETCGTTFESEVAFYRVTPGALPGIFTVGDDAKTGIKYVRFSKGNLQYLPTSAVGDSVWRFAPNQYDFIGDGTTYGGSANTYSAGNQYVEYARNHTTLKVNDVDTPADELWYDLFGWGTSGKAPYDATHTETHPLSTGTTYSKYCEKSFTGTYAEYDWGVYNKIVLGGDQSNLWRTLTNTEWNYLITTRRASDGITLLYGHGRIETASSTYVNGLFIFPDGFIDIMDPDHPGKTLKTARGAQAWADNTITLSQWKALEKVGVVFLPASGNRNGIKINSVNSTGWYWSSTNGSYGYGAYNCTFSSGSIKPVDDYRGAYYKHYGYSVRLVQDFTK